VQPIADLVPPGDVIHEAGIELRLVERPVELALDTAQPDRHIVARRDVQGRLARVLVCQSIDDDVRMLLRDGIGDGVHEVEERSALGALLRRQRRALLTLAVVVPVVLADGDDRRVGSLVDPAANRLDGDLQHVGVRQAELSVV